MNIVKKEELLEFVNTIKNFDSFKHPQKIVAFGYYLTKIVNLPFFDQKSIRQCYELLDDSPPVNPSDFLRRLKESKKIVLLDEGYRLHRLEVNELEASLRPTINDASDKNSIVKTIGGSDKKLLQENSSQSSFDKKYFDKTRANEALALIKQFDSLQIHKFRIVGHYVRFSDKTRQTLKNMKQKIIAGLKTTSNAKENYLVWGPPGSGKSFFVQEIARSLGDGTDYREINLTKLDKTAFQTELAKLEKIEKPCICLIDEVDSDSARTWICEILLTYLFPTKPTKFRICFILAGSSGSGITQMKEKIASQNKGSDLLSRIPSMNEYIVTPLDMGDNLVVGVIQLMKIAVESKKTINEVEKLALFYIAVNPAFTSARQVSELMERAIKRVSEGEDRVKYDHLFEPGDPINKEFWEKAKSLDGNLSNSFVFVED